MLNGFLMRLVLAAVLAVPLMAQAETATKKAAPRKPIVLGPVEVNGKREVAVGLVLQRDQSIKSELDRSVDEHVREAARR